MDLSCSTLLYLFLECAAAAKQQTVLATELGLRLVEVEPDERHRHGVAKFDCGTILIALNKSPNRRFRPASSDALVTVVRGGRGDPRVLTDVYGHHFEIVPAVIPSRRECAALKLIVDNIDESVEFYQRKLDLALTQRDKQSACLQIGNISLMLCEGDRSVDGLQLRYDTYLLVFHTPSIIDTRGGLIDRGIAFLGRGVTSTPIGATARFTDPSGHQLCLYEPSPAALALPSGAATRRILAAPQPIHAP